MPQMNQFTAGLNAMPQGAPSMGGMQGGANPNLAMFGHFANMPMQPPGAMQGQQGGQPGGQPGGNSNLMALFAALQNHPALSGALNPANIPNATQFQPQQQNFPAPAQAAPAAPPPAAATPTAAAPATANPLDGILGPGWNTGFSGSAAGNG
jgi:hypothetical protein